MDRAREVAASARERVPREDEPRRNPEGRRRTPRRIYARRPGDGPRVGAAAARVRILRIVSDAADGFSKAEATPAERLAAATRATPASDGVRAGYTPSRAARARSRRSSRASDFSSLVYRCTVVVGISIARREPFFSFY